VYIQKTLYTFVIIKRIWSLTEHHFLFSQLPCLFQVDAAPATKMAAATVPAIPPIVLERVGEPKVIDEASIDELQAIIKEYYDR
jgi:hypothetical protein